MTIEITAYKTTDGLVFESQQRADAHQADIIGEALDNLLAHDGRGNVTQSDRFNILMNTMNDQDFKQKVTDLFNAIQDE